MMRTSIVTLVDKPNWDDAMIMQGCPIRQHSGTPLPPFLANQPGRSRGHCFPTMRPAPSLTVRYGGPR